MSLRKSEPRSGEATPRGGSWHAAIPDLLIGVALLSLLTLIVALALGWVT